MPVSPVRRTDELECDANFANLMDSFIFRSFPIISSKVKCASAPMYEVTNFLTLSISLKKSTTPAKFPSTSLKTTAVFIKWRVPLEGLSIMNSLSTYPLRVLNTLSITGVKSTISVTFLLTTLSLFTLRIDAPILFI